MKLESNEINNYEHDATIGAKRVMPYGWDGSKAVAQKVNSAGEVMVSSLVPEKYDYISLAQNELTDAWTYKVGGSDGNTVATVTVTFTTSEKSIISSVARS